MLSGFIFLTVVFHFRDLAVWRFLYDERQDIIRTFSQ